MVWAWVLSSTPVSPLSALELRNPHWESSLELDVVARALCHSTREVGMRGSGVWVITGYVASLRPV